jgi:hypothetical protein
MLFSNVFDVASSRLLEVCNSSQLLSTTVSEAERGVLTNIESKAGPFGADGSTSEAET